MHYYKKNIGDYIKKTARLSLLQHGAHTLLIDSCYDRERFPTLDDAYDWLLPMDDDERGAIKFILNRFFILVDGFYVQNRIQEELDAYKAKSLKNKEIAIKREHAKREASTQDKHETCTERSPQTHLTKNQEPRTNKEKTIKKRMMDYPTDFTIGAKSKEFAASHGIDANYELEQFRNHALANGKQFVNWQAGFRTWLGNAVKFAGKKNNVVSLQTQTESFYEYL